MSVSATELDDALRILRDESNAPGSEIRGTAQVAGK
ncbi:predicted protein [Sclerotinia sclerotiorum 1980 UF-70]|uniref:Uncharacterized protein n=1 Tax=Sclerotinia sclerotiorum (strain ATCC 18683 / 1980 / Ss-1) TaxID=665079 RepID=A7EXY8_SCLS1|nr:predicted protein [Sclerotinia sclerotiorum 1980 UF-70]EDN94330.1 predicted protein [Sclerotinia sclerotiorum 1980 UF-70]